MHLYGASSYPECDFGYMTKKHRKVDKKTDTTKPSESEM